MGLEAEMITKTQLGTLKAIKVARVYIGSGGFAFFEGTILDRDFDGMIVVEQNGSDKIIVYVPHENVLAVERLS
jgi:hypothetical protein